MGDAIKKVRKKKEEEKKNKKNRSTEKEFRRRLNENFKGYCSSKIDEPHNLLSNSNNSTAQLAGLYIIATGCFLYLICKAKRWTKHAPIRDSFGFLKDSERNS